MQDFRNLKVWQRAHQLVLAIYEHTATFPRDEIYGLTSQVRRSASSIPANIAEGCGRGNDGDLRRSLQIAMGSASELEYQLLLAYELKLLEDGTHSQLTTSVIDVKRMLASFIARLKAES